MKSNSEGFITNVSTQENPTVVRPISLGLFSQRMVGHADVLGNHPQSPATLSRPPLILSFLSCLPSDI